MHKTIKIVLILALCAVCLVSCAKTPAKKNAAQKNEVKSEQTNTEKKASEKETTKTKDATKTKDTTKTDDPDAEMNKYYADMAPKDVYATYEADTRFHVDYPADFVEDTKQSKDGKVIYRSPDKKQSVTVTVTPIGETDYKAYTESVRKEFKEIKIYEYGDESFTAMCQDDGKGNSIYMYLSFDSGKIYRVEQLYPVGKEIVSFRPWFE